MLPKTFGRLLICATLISILIFLPHVEAQAFKVSVNTDKQLYSLGNSVHTYGNLVLSGNPVTDGQVAVQINDPQGNVFILRTIPTGQSVLPPFMVEILDVYPSDLYGNPKSSFSRGTFAFFAVNVRNNDQITERTATISINVYYATGVPFDCFYISYTIYPATTQTIITPSIPIPSDAPTGTARAYADAFTDLLSEGGYAYSPEKNATFSITAGGAGSLGIDTNSAKNEKTSVQALSTEGGYDLIFRLPSKEGLLGNYTVYVHSYYQGNHATNQTSFRVTLLGDVNHDCKVDMKDIGIVVKAFGSVPGDLRWNPNADINGDGKVDMKDIGIVVADFGKVSA